MQQITFQSPAPRLRPFVAVYWHLSARLGRDDVQSYVPGLGTAWIFNRALPGAARVGASQSGLPQHFVKGPMTLASHVSPDGQMDNFGIAFKPGASGLFSPVPLVELRDGLTDIAAMGDPDLARLARAVEPATFHQAVAAFDQFLGRRLEQADNPHLGRLLYGALGGGGANAVATSGYSERHLRRLYQDTLGLSPKAAARVERLRKALGAINEGAASLTDIAVQAGFFDQAHLNRDFKAMIGTSPTAYRAGLAPLAQRFNAFDDRAA